MVTMLLTVAQLHLPNTTSVQSQENAWRGNSSKGRTSRFLQHKPLWTSIRKHSSGFGSRSTACHVQFEGSTSAESGNSIEGRSSTNRGQNRLSCCTEQQGWSPEEFTSRGLLHNAAKVLIASFVAWVLSVHLYSGIAYAASESIAASNLGLRIAGFLRKSGWADELIVFTLATLPVLELRGAIPVGYWMQLDPLKVYLLSIIGNMVPVPLVLLYLDKFSAFLAERSSIAKRVLDALYNSTRRKAGLIEEFKWLGLMLFVAVPLPGTGAWTGAIAAVILGMPFWSSFWANLFGVLIAGILMNLLVSLGLKYALIVGILLFALSTFMWSILRYFSRRRRAEQ